MEVYERLERLRRRAELEQRMNAAADPAPLSDHAVSESLLPEWRAGENLSPEPKAPGLSALLDVEPGAGEFGVGKFGVGEPDIAEPDIGWLVAVEPEAVESDAVEPETEASDAAEPGIAEPGIAEQGIAEPDTIELARLPAAADGGSTQSPETVGTSLPVPLTQMVNEVLAALQSVLQRYPGLIVGIWPPGRATEDLNAAIRFTLDAATGVSLRMPDTGTPDTGTSDTGTPDTGTPDTGTPDTGTPDTGTPDTGTPDTGTPDTGTPDTARTGGELRDAGSPASRSVAVELASLLRNGLSDR